MARIPVQHLVLLVGKTFVIFVFCLFNSLCLLFTCNIIFAYTMFIYYIGDFDAHIKYWLLSCFRTKLEG
jgi:hypothetical protein